MGTETKKGKPSLRELYKLVCKEDYKTSPSNVALAKLSAPTLVGLDTNLTKALMSYED